MSNPSGDMSGIKLVLDTFRDTIVNLGNNNPLTDLGIGLLFSIIAMLIVFQSLRTLLEGGSGRQLISQFLYLVMLGSFASLLITDDFKLKQKLIDSADMIADKVSPIGAGSGGFDSAASAINVMFDAAFTIFDSEAPSANFGQDLLGDEKGSDPAAKTAPGGSVWGAITNIAVYLGSGLQIALMTILLKFFAMAIMILGGLIAMAQFVVSQVLVHIAIILAPIFAPFLVWEQASFLFDGWLKFFIKGVFHKVVGLIMVGLLNSTVSVALSKISAMRIESFAEGQALRLSALIGIMSIAAIFAYLMWQIGSIADGMLSGSTRAGFKPGKVPKLPPTLKPDSKPGGQGPTGGNAGGGSGGSPGGNLSPSKSSAAGGGAGSSLPTTTPGTSGAFKL